MNQVGVLLLVAAGSCVAFRGSLKAATWVLLGFWLLVPGTLRVPGAPSQVVVIRVVLLAFALGLVLRHNRGELADAAFRPTLAHAAFAAFLAITFVNGVLIAPPPVTTQSALNNWLRDGDQLVFFVCVLAVARTLDPMWLARAVARLVVVTALIAVGERVTGAGWSHAFFVSLPGQALEPGARALAVRNGHVRSQVAAQFALEYAWVATILLPVVVVMASRARRRRVQLAPVLVLLAIALSASRSSLVGLAIGAAVLAGGARLQARLTRNLVGGIALGLVLLAGVPGLRAPFTKRASDTGSISVRKDRYPVITAAAAGRPYTGIGLSGLAKRGIATTDMSYLLVYAEVGVVGLTAFVALLLTGVLTAAGGLRGPPSELRTLGAGVAAGAVLVPVAAAAYDLSSVPQSTWALWLLAALGVALAERAPVRDPYVRFRSPARALLPVAGVLAGIMAAAAAPTHAAGLFRFEALSDYHIARNRADEGFTGRLFVETACGVAEGYGRLQPQLSLSCRWLGAGPGLGEIRVQTPIASRTLTEMRAVQDKLRATLPFFQAHALGPLRIDRPTWAGTAHVWGGCAGTALALLIPPMPSWAGRRRRVRAPALVSV